MGSMLTSPAISRLGLLLRQDNLSDRITSICLEENMPSMAVRESSGSCFQGVAHFVSKPYP